MDNTRFTYEEALQKITKIGGQPVAIEVQWDGDTTGWYLIMFVVIRKSSTSPETHYLGNLSTGGDIRIFTGEVPPYPESVLAKEIGEKLSEKYNVEFFFPSPDHPDNDCPRWFEKHLAINCGDCQKLIIPTTSSYLPKDICYNCHLRRERNQRIIEEVSVNSNVYLYLYKNDAYESVGYCSDFSSFKIAPFIKQLVEAEPVKLGIKVVTIDKTAMIKLCSDLENETRFQFSKYIPPSPERAKSRFITIEKVEYQGKEYELMERFNEQHQELSRLLSSLKNVKKAVAENYEYKLFFKEGITAREDSILRFIHYVKKGTAAFESIYQEYDKIITAAEVAKTLLKLASIDCITLADNQATLTITGRNII